MQRWRTIADITVTDGWLTGTGLFLMAQIVFLAQWLVRLGNRTNQIERTAELAHERAALVSTELSHHSTRLALLESHVADAKASLSEIRADQKAVLNYVREADRRETA